MSPPGSLDEGATRARLPWPALVDALARALVERADGRIACPARTVVPMADGALLLSMPAVAADVAIHKLITVAPGNRRRGWPAIVGHVTVLDPRSGRVIATLDGPTVTGRRTAAMSMLAVRMLRPGRIASALMIGTGVQAGHHVDAMAALHPGIELAVRGTSAAAVDAFLHRHAGAPLALRVDAPGDAHHDVVFACTTSRTPVYRDAARADRLVVAVGAFEPGVAEIDAAVVRASACYVDDPDGAAHEAGDLIAAGVDRSAVRALVDAQSVPPPADVPRLFKSVGCAAWDLAAARVAAGAVG